ncbi:lipopolysaccharide biosynthesis protein [Aestuariispira insulae]|uniref:O-antigen/teichoic acid export membrane protein n=1 Tax=Aestuariispira insulae TaxID=1461337 RepID=A0A3D9HK78_9PROT|nr:lipopolysaccharide biosynthesis protein [Aestuariispira insulae]RED49873.1 O-antigen/teichoic acid export membrane protein [Aestuariispira insulae]
MKEQVLHAMRWSLILKVIAQSGNWIMTILVMRMLTPDDYGIMAMAVAYYGFFFLLRDFGLSTALVQNRNATTDDFRNVLGLLILINLGFSAFGYLTAPIIAGFYGEADLVPLGQLISLGVLISALGIIPDTHLKREMMFKQRTMVETVSRLSSGLISLAMAYNGYGFWSLAAAYLLYQLFCAIGKFAVAPFWHLPSFSLKPIRKLMKFGGVISVHSIFSYIFTETDKFIIGKMLSATSLGLYEVARTTVSLPVVKLSEVIQAILLTTFSISGDKIATVSYQFSRALQVGTFIFFPVMFGISAIAPEVISVLLGEKWEPAVPLMVLLAIAVAFQSIEVLLNPTLNAIGKPSLTLSITIVNVIIVLPAILISTNWGIYGVCVAWVAAYPIALLINFARCMPHLDLSFLTVINHLSRPLMASFIMWTALYFCRNHLLADMGDLAWLGLAIPAGGLIYVVCSFLFNRDVFLYFAKLVVNR